MLEEQQRQEIRQRFLACVQRTSEACGGSLWSRSELAEMSRQEAVSAPYLVSIWGGECGERQALKRAKSHIQAEKIKVAEEKALARWGKERIPTEI
jgi:hypothetical protein